MLRSAFLALFLWFVVAVPAHAWTRAHVREADIELSLDPDSALRVVAQLRVEVTGGWLERLEIAGLAQLPTEASELEAWLVAEDGSEVRAETRVKDEQLELRFAREGAPRRGNHRLFVRYQVPSASLSFGSTAGNTLRLDWTLPGWEAGLSRAAVHWELPEGAQAVPDAELAEQITTSPVSNQRTRISFERVHVPRESPWRVSVDVPATAWGIAKPQHATAHRVSSPWRERGPLALATAWVLLLCWAARGHTRRWAAREGMQTRSVWLARAGQRGGAYLPWLALLLGGGAAWLSGHSLGAACAAVLAMTLVLVEHTVPSAGPVHHGHFEPVGALDLLNLRRQLRRERVGVGPFQDAASVLGALGVGLSVLAAYVGAGGFDGHVVPWCLIVACGVVPLFAASRWRLPRSLSARVGTLATAADRLRLPGVGLRLVWRRSDSSVLRSPAPGRASTHTEPRLRVFCARPHQGLLRIDVMADSRPGACALTLCAVVLADSTAARALASQWSDAVCVHSGSGKRLAFARPTVALEQDLEQLLGVLSAQDQRALESLLEETARHAA